MTEIRAGTAQDRTRLAYAWAEITGDTRSDIDALPRRRQLIRAGKAAKVLAEGRERAVWPSDFPRIVLRFTVQERNGSYRRVERWIEPGENPSRLPRGAHLLGDVQIVANPRVTAIDPIRSRATEVDQVECGTADVTDIVDIEGVPTVRNYRITRERLPVGATVVGSWIEGPFMVPAAYPGVLKGLDPKDALDWGGA